MRDTWETTVRTAADTMLRYPDKISDGLEAEPYALLEQLGAPETGQPPVPGSPVMPHDPVDGQHRHRPPPAAGQVVRT